MMRKIIDLMFSMFTMAIFLVVVYMILLKLTNHSPTLSQVNMTLIVLMAGFLFKINHDTGKFSFFMEHTQENIKELKSDFKDLRKDVSSKLDKLNAKFEKINEELLFIKSKLA